MLLRSWFRSCYQIVFAIVKYIRYPHASILTNQIYPGVKIGRGVVIERDARVYRNVSIGDYTFINTGSSIEPNTSRIGKFCSISHNTKVGVGPHPLDRISTSAVLYMPARGAVRSQLYDEFADKGYCEIGNDVLIGASAIVIAGVKIGDGAVIGAGSVVTKDVPPYAIVCGAPARIIKFRFTPNMIARIVATQWWDRDIRLLADLAERGLSISEFLDELEKEDKRGG